EIVLTGTDDTGASVSRTIQTDAGGRFAFDGLRPGTYVLTEPEQPDGTSNGITTPGTVGGNPYGTATQVETVPSAISGIDLTVPGGESIDNLFGEIPLNSAIAGRVWLDSDDDGVIDAGEEGIAGVSVHLTGTDATGAAIERETVTDAEGRYE